MTEEREDVSLSNLCGGAIEEVFQLKEQTTMKPRVNLAPYRTFAEIDQQLSQFIFRARVGNDSVNLALFEADGGRWHLSAVAAITDWLANKIGGKVPVIS